jgi:hypothetical protein
LRLYPPIDIHRWSDSQQSLVFTVTEPLQPGRTYVLPFRNKRWADLSGNGLEPLDYSFTTAARD